MANKRSIIVRGTPVINEDGVADAEVRPGYLVTGVATIIEAAVAGANIPRAVALERDELGLGIDNTKQSTGQATAFYASGDTVKVATGAPGDEFTMFLASGYGVAVGDDVESHGDGTLRPQEGSDTPLGISLDAHTGDATVPAIRVRVF